MEPKPNWIDWLAYRFFYWRWNRLFLNNRKLCRYFVDCWNQWQEIESVERMKLKHWHETPTTQPAESE